jgi:hypothetical protein
VVAADKNADRRTENESVHAAAAGQRVIAVGAVEDVGQAVADDGVSVA